MTRGLISLSLLCGLAASVLAGDALAFWKPDRTKIERHMGRPYVWGACGLKSFDCSGFVWRVMLDNGIFIKRTTARKLFMSLPRLGEGGRWDYGNLVFFDNLKHVGIVNERSSFYHAQSSRGTNLSSFDPFWRGKIAGFRGVKAAGR